MRTGIYHITPVPAAPPEADNGIQWWSYVLGSTSSETLHEGDGSLAPISAGSIP